MNSRAQSALEYLMTYGWTLIVISLAVGTLVFVITPPSEVSFASTSTRLLLKDSEVDSAGNTGIVLQNATGGAISVSGLYLIGDFGDFADAELVVQGDLRVRTSITPSNTVSVPAGAEMTIRNVRYTGNGSVNGKIMLEYTTRFGLRETTDIIASGSMPRPVTMQPASTTISSAGEYYLAGDMTETITISASNVVLNCDGKTISSESDIAIHMTTGGSNITVSNCRLINSDSGFLVESITNVTLTNNYIAGMDSWGFIVINSSDAAIANNVIESSGAGFLVNFGSSGAFRNNTACVNPGNPLCGSTVFTQTRSRNNIMGSSADQFLLACGIQSSPCP